MEKTSYGVTIAKNLRDIMYRENKAQADVARALGISKATLSSWMNGTRLPKMKNIDMLCHYFNVTRMDLLEERAKKEVPLTNTEKRLMAYFRALSKEGQDNAMGYVDYLRTQEEKKGAR